MRQSMHIPALGMLLVFAGMMAHAGHAIPAEEIDSQKIYHGDPSSFENAAEVDFETVVKATPEYSDIDRGNVERGTGKYWILMSQASDRANRAIVKVGQESEHDLIAAKDYLATVDEEIAVEDLTGKVVASLEEDEE